MMANWRKASILLMVLTVVTLVGFNGCGGEDSTSPSDGDNPPPGDGDSFVVGPLGGSFTVADGTVVMDFPADAVSSEINVTVDPETTFPVDPGMVDGTCFTFGPDATVFGESVTVTLSYSPDALPSGVDELSLRLSKVEGNAWETVSGYSLDTENNTISAPLLGFSTYGILGLNTPGEAWEGNYTILNQDDVDAFIDVTNISGTLKIYDDIADTISLPALLAVGGDLQVVGAISGNIMTRLSLPNLKIVEGVLSARQCETLTELDLPACESVAHIYFESNDALTDVSGLSALRTVNPLGLEGRGGIGFLHNHELRSLAGLSGISGRVRALSIRYNYKLRSLAGLAGISRIDEDLEISDTDSLGSLAGLAPVFVGGRCSIWFHTNLRDLIGLTRLSWVERDLVIERCARLTNLNGLESLSHVGTSLGIRGNENLVSLDGLGPLASLDGGSLEIRDNPELVDLDALSHLHHIEYSLSVYANESLTTLHGLHNLTHIGDTLEVQYNFDLEDLDGLGSLVHAWGNIRISYNVHLMDVTGLLGLQANPANGYACLSFTATDNCDMIPCVGNAAFHAIVDDFGGENMVEGEVTIEHN